MTLAPVMRWNGGAAAEWSGHELRRSWHLRRGELRPGITERHEVHDSAALSLDRTGGRLVYTDLGWTLTSGPARQPRPTESLGRGLA